MLTFAFFITSLTALSPTQYGTSEIVAEGHEHDWVMLEGDPTSGVWWDRNSVTTLPTAESEYPTVVMRIVFSGERMPFEQMDVRMNIDCEANLIGAIDTYMVGPQLPEPIRVKSNDAPSDELPGSSAEGTGTFMRAICGEDWTL